MQVSGMLPNPFNKPGKASKMPMPKAPMVPKAAPKAAPKGKAGGQFPHRNLGAFLHPKKGK